MAQRAKELEVSGERSFGSGEELPDGRVDRLVALGRALSDPIRVRMLGMMAEGRDRCSLPDCGVPTRDHDAGICVCEFEGYFGMGQSRVSYHMRRLKEAGLVRETKRGRWSFYSLNERAARDLVSGTAGWLLGDRRAPGGKTP